MRMRGSDSWSIGIGSGGQHHNWPLWIRAAEGIDVPAGGVVPGPLDIAPLPAPTLPSAAPLAEGWLGWWRAVLGLSRPTGPDEIARFVELGPPDFAGLAAWPLLREVVVRRFAEADDWHRTRSPAGPLVHPPHTPHLSLFVREIERSLGRRSAPFELEFILLPVRDDKVRPIDGKRFLVPERLYDSPAWFDWLRPVITRLAAGA
ncbi:hypothetical protein [Phytohabitans suffuscus]|uniref:Uncharacterized protein n=1 Tax=Phytohabitans suffuscus TaxID=624315 RepID=A0A6F8Z147_9ACTN|nr:hypothetical protein [Phytohabitans suffuscus]BCB92117.1 hypothetical protein Psuf_094300 [Phytohabitans suffuscus]